MKKITQFGLFALVVVGLIFSAGIANAYRGDFTINGPDYNEERHESMENAFESLDYDAWYEIMTENGRNSRVVEFVTESNFKTFVQAHNVGMNGDFELASTLRSEFGLNNSNGPQDGTGFGKGMGQRQGQGNGQGKGRN